MVMSEELPLVRVRLKYPDVETFSDRFAPNVTRGGIFLASRDPRPVGTVVRFEVSLVSGTPVLVGKGRVTWTKVYDPAEPNKPYGMGVQFIELEGPSRAVLDRLLRKREPSRPPPLPRPTSSPPPTPSELAKTQRLRHPLRPAPEPEAGADADPTVVQARPMPEPVRPTPEAVRPIAEAHSMPEPVRPATMADLLAPVARSLVDSAMLPEELVALDRMQEADLQRILERARVLAAGIEDVQDLLRASSEPPLTLAQALVELPRYLGIRSDPTPPVH